MTYDLAYFKDFLADPAAPDINEFFRLLHEWIKYIESHKHEFNYLEDDEWKEVRERLLDELEFRLDIKEDLQAEWDELLETVEKFENLTDEEVVEYTQRRLEFMKNYQHVFKIPDEDIAELERLTTDCLESMRASKIAAEQSRLAKLRLDESIANLDDSLSDYYERTGKRIILPAYRRKKVYRGN